MIDELDIMLGDSASNYTEALKSLILRQTKTEVEAYCGRKLNAELELIALRITVIKLNRTNTEGLASQAYSGVSESYIDGYPADILAILNKNRRIRVVG